MKKMMKAITPIVVFALAVVGFASCAKKDSATLILGTSADYPPYEFHAQIDGKDTIVGFDVEIAKEVAKDLGKKLEIKDMDFDGLLAALVSGNVDIVVSGMTPTEERKQNVDFSDIYYQAEHGVLIRKSNEDKYATAMNSLRDEMMGAQRGAIQVGLAKIYIKGLSEEEADAPHPQIKELGKLPDLIMELKNSKIEAVVAELPVAKAYLGANKDLMLASYTITDDDGGSAIAVKKGNEELVASINKTIARLISEGKINEFVATATEMVEY